MNRHDEPRIGGVLLLLGAATILVTIYFEFRIGWIGVERPPAEVPFFFRDQWTKLEPIWRGQTFGFATCTLAAMLLMKGARGWMSALWAVSVLAGVCVVVGFGMCLGGYPSSLAVYETQPVVFDSLRAVVGVLYGLGVQVLILSWVVAFVLGVVRREGVVGRRLGWATIAFVVASIVLGLVSPLDVKVTGAAVFLVPAVLGFSYWTSGGKVATGPG